MREDYNTAIDIIYTNYFIICILGREKEYAKRNT